MDSVTTSIVYPDPLESYSANRVPQPFYVSVTFRGAVPPSVLRGDIPLQISISLPQEYAHFTSPVLRALPAWSASDGTASIVSICLECQFYRYYSHIHPLPSTFDPSERSSWIALAPEIERWLLTEVINVRSPDWLWGRNVFWMAFIAAYPDFPRGEWPVWNTKIAMEGPFIENWMEQSEEHSEASYQYSPQKRAE
ncbi:hypothetical protein B0H21DRAFT_707190 [Amylocystis lapponica]|nr:hypothetical protein B0H21DRAFT_707190 [Amylocystis lapponica]